MKNSLVTVVLLILGSPTAWTDTRSYDGTGNDPVNPLDGVVGQPMLRVSYDAEYPGDGTGSTMISSQRPNPRDISNAIFSQSSGIPNTRGLSDYVWVWGQFLAHDLGHKTTHNDEQVNGTAPINVNDPWDPFGPGSTIPFVRSDFVTNPAGIREQINSVTSYIDASQIYGSDSHRATALRTNNGMGAKLATSAENLLIKNVNLLANTNNGPFADDLLFLAGDVRANENALLTSMHTLFMREHNRLVDIINTQRPDISDEETYQLARKIVGAEMQIITYNEFLPALVGSANAPLATDYDYASGQSASLTQSFSHVAFRFAHSAVSPIFQLVENDGTHSSELSLVSASYNPSILTAEPSNLELLLKGAASQTAQEIDTLMVDELRNLTFGPPNSGAGGMDLAAADIQRGRDHGLPDYLELSASYQLPLNLDFDDITTDEALATALRSLYADDIHNIDSWVGMLAEDHLPGSSLGALGQEIIIDQFLRIRDADRLFYLSDDLELYEAGFLKPEVAAIIDLDNFTLADVIMANTTLTTLQPNLFYVENGLAGDFNCNGAVDLIDLNLTLFNWDTDASAISTDWVNGRPPENENVGLNQLNKVLFNWNEISSSAMVPEPHTILFLLGMAIALVFVHRARN